jgi:hypothetical protein
VARHFLCGLHLQRERVEDGDPRISRGLPKVADVAHRGDLEFPLKRDGLVDQL